jgi:hypothetical protein
LALGLRIYQIYEKSLKVFVKIPYFRKPWFGQAQVISPRCGKRREVVD